MNPACLCVDLPKKRKSKEIANPNLLYSSSLCVCVSAVVRRRVGAVKSLSFVSDRARARGYLHSALYEARGSCVFCMSSPEHLIFIVRLWPVIRIFRTVIQIETNLAIGTV